MKLPSVDEEGMDKLKLIALGTGALVLFGVAAKLAMIFQAAISVAGVHGVGQ